MKFYLSSYKYGTEKTKEVLKDWIKVHGNKVVYIANSRDYKENNDIKFSRIEADKDCLREIGFEIIEISLKDYFGKESELEEKLRNYNTFCLIGGNVFVLRKAMELSGFDKFIKDNLYNKNMLYIGYSAGICLLGETLKGLDLVDEPINVYNDDAILYEGVGIFKETLVPHYKSEHPETEAIDNVVEYLEKNNIDFITLHDGEVIIKEF